MTGIIENLQQWSQIYYMNGLRGIFTCDLHAARCWKIVNHIAVQRARHSCVKMFAAATAAKYEKSTHGSGIATMRVAAGRAAE